jgi:hypothetical protein
MNWSTSPKLGALTGKARGRPALFGKVIMQVEKWGLKSEYRYPNPPRKSKVVTADMLTTYWEDASTTDIMSNVHFEI